MLSKEQSDIIKAIQDLQDKLINDMDGKLPTIFKDLANQVIEISNEFSFDAKERVANLQKLRKLKTQIADAIVNNTAYQVAVKEVLTGFKEIKKLSDSYYSALIDGYSAKSELYKQILESNIQTTTDLLLGAEIRSNFDNAITQVLKENIAGNTNRTNLQNVLREFIKGTPDQRAYLERYVKQVTNDSVMIFSREYNSVVSDDLNLQFYTYVGTRIDTSRPFCDARAGRFFKKSEVESWASLGNWQGRMPGTTKTTIFSLAGGFNCRHELYAISQTQYKAAEKRNLTGLR
jgi:hypothetical protein